MSIQFVQIWNLFYHILNSGYNTFTKVCKHCSWHSIKNEYTQCKKVLRIHKTTVSSKIRRCSNVPNVWYKKQYPFDPVQNWFFTTVTDGQRGSVIFFWKAWWIMWKFDGDVTSVFTAVKVNKKIPDSKWLDTEHDGQHCVKSLEKHTLKPSAPLV